MLWFQEVEHKDNVQLREIVKSMKCVRYRGKHKLTVRNYICKIFFRVLKDMVDCEHG